MTSLMRPAVERPNDPLSAGGALVDIRDLRLNFNTFDGVSKVLAGVNLTIEHGDVFGLVGETGCGKTMTARAVARAGSAATCR